MKEQIKLIIGKMPFIKTILTNRNEKRNIDDFYQLVKTNPPIFIYQMGKVASSSTYQSIKKQHSSICIHAHSFSKNNAKPHVRALFEIFQREKLPIKIISMVREPISRNISAFFENFERDTGTKYKNNQYSIEELKNIFLKNYKHEIPIEWFDKNIKENFGIDVYKSSFPERGYDFFKNGKVELLLFKHDIENVIKEEIISDFVGIKNFKIFNANVGDKKEYASTYKKFRELNLPENYLDNMLNSKYATHFYSKDLKEIKQKWTKKSH